MRHADTRLLSGSRLSTAAKLDVPRSKDTLQRIALQRRCNLLIAGKWVASGHEKRLQDMLRQQSCRQTTGVEVAVPSHEGISKFVAGPSIKRQETPQRQKCKQSIEGKGVVPSRADASKIVVKQKITPQRRCKLCAVERSNAPKPRTVQQHTMLQYDYKQRIGGILDA
jgi:hypothetical protein